MSLNSQFKEIKGRTFFRFEIISLAIKRIAVITSLLSAHFGDFSIRPTLYDVSLPFFLTKVIHFNQYITLLSLWDLQCFPRKHVFNGLKCNVPSQKFRRR